MNGSLLDGFFTGSKYSTKTYKQKLEARIKDSVLNLVIERDQSFLHTARKNNTSIIVNNREGGIQEFTHNGRDYISFPSSFEEKLSEMEYSEAEEYLDKVIKMVVTKTDIDFEKDVVGKQAEKINQYEEITGKDLKLDEQLLEYRISNDENSNKDDANDGEYEDDNGGAIPTRLTAKGMSDSNRDKDESISEMKNEYSFQDTDLSMNDSTMKEFSENYFWNTDNSYGITEKEEHHLQELANQIVKSFKGRVSKLKTIVPSKKLVSKSLILDNTEKIYQNKKGNNGKHLNVNLIIDMSGSMEGTPVLNATRMIYIFNEIARKGKLNGCVIWSEKNHRYKVNFPMPRDAVKRMTYTGATEGLGKNLKYYKDELKSVDANICMTDGQLNDDPILKSMYAKEKIDIIGVYVNEDAEDLTEYTGSLDRWFTKSLVRRDINELCQKLIQIGLRRKGK
jgi:hypothetical protein